MDSLNEIPQSTKLLQAQVDELYREGLPGIVSAFVCAVFLTVALWHTVWTWGIVVWLCTLSISLIPRFLLIRAYRKAAPTADTSLWWARMFAVGTASGALFWAALPVFLFPENQPLSQALITFVIGGLSVGITVANGARRESQVPFIVIAFTVLAGRFFYEGSRDYFIMGALLVTFTIFLLGAAHRIHVKITDLLKLRFDKDDIIDSLAAEHALSTRLNEDLKRARDELENRVSERTTELLDANKRLEKEIEERKQAEEALRESQAQYRLHFENVHDVIFSYDKDLRIFNVSPSAEYLFGYKVKDLIGKYIFDLNVLDEEDIPVALEHIKKIFNGETIDAARYRFYNSNRELRLVEVSGAPLVREGRIIGVVSVARDVTDRIRTEEELRRAHEELEEKVQERTKELRNINTVLELQIEERKRAEERYRTVVDLAPVPISIQAGGSIVFVNQAAADAMRVSTPEELIGRPLKEFLDPLSYDYAKARTAMMIEKWQPAPVIQVSGKRADGTLGWAEVYSAPIIYDGRNAIVTFTIDVSERKEHEEKLRSSLKEKEILLREVHHRVKNNLQLISSILSLQELHCHGRDAASVLKEAEGRVWSMALVHEMLYRARDMSRISAGEFLGKLVEYIFASSSADGDKVALFTHFEDGTLQIDQAINCGLILNELITNCLKHAFPGEREGEIRIELNFDEEQSVHISVKDNGVGMPVDIDLQSVNSFGLDLVKTLVEEVKGCIQLKNDRGTHFLISFPQSQT